MDKLLELKIGPLWQGFKNESFSFWMISAYLIVEYVRPQSIIPALDFLPWAQVFILLSLVGLLTDQSKRWVSSSINMWMVLYLVVIVISSVLAYQPAVSYEFLPNFYLWLIIYFLIINIINNETRLLIFLLIFMLASFKISVFGARTWAFRGFSFTTWGLMGPPGYFQNSGELAIQMAVFFGMSYFFFISVKEKVGRLVYWALLLAPITSAMTIMGASSRGGQVALALQLGLIFYRKISLKMIIGGVIIVWLGYSMLPAEQLDRFESAGSDRTSQQRLLYWEHGWDMMKKYPAFGVGYFNFSSYYERYFPADMLYANAQLPHNIFVQVGADLGFVGLFIYLMMIIKSFRHTAEVRRLEGGGVENRTWLYNMSLGLDIGFCGFLLAGQFVSVVYYPFMWIHLALVVALRNVVLHKHQAK